MNTIAKGLWALVAIALISGIGTYIYKKQHAAKNLESYSQGKSLIGGPFTLRDHKGRVRSDTEFKNKYMLVYFGYSYCPDVCPTGLQAITEAMNELGPDADMIQPLFITVDPARDTEAQLYEYMKNFHPKFLALTGSDDDVKTAMKAYKVYAAKSEEENRGAQDYLIDHSSIVYLMAPGGEHILHFTHATPGTEMAEKIKKIIGKS